MSDKDDILKALKYNQTMSEKALEEACKSNIVYEKDIDSHRLFLDQAEKKLGIDRTDIRGLSDYDETALEEELRSIDVDDIEHSDIVKAANNAFPVRVSFSDLLTPEELKKSDERVERINEAFWDKTHLGSVDLAFLGIAIALQCVRQYVLDPFLKDIRKKASPKDENGSKENADEGWYYVETEKILINRVPYDVQHYGENKSIQGFLKGGDHRAMTLGHDPILGWIFGTANILTSTVTRRDLVSAHVKSDSKGNYIHSLASTTRVFKACWHSDWWRNGHDGS